MTMPDPEALRIAGALTELERELLLGRSERWGSWMWSCGTGLVAKGLGTRTAGNIQFDTPLADRVRAALQSMERGDG